MFWVILWFTTFCNTAPSFCKIKMFASMMMPLRRSPTIRFFNDFISFIWTVLISPGYTVSLCLHWSFLCSMHMNYAGWKIDGNIHVIHELILQDLIKIRNKINFTIWLNASIGIDHLGPMVKKVIFTSILFIIKKLKASESFPRLYLMCCYYMFMSILPPKDQFIWNKYIWMFIW